MKIEFYEREEGIDITLNPETVEEMAQLARFSNNVKAEKPDVWLNFANQPTCYIYLHKKKKGVQKNRIGNS